MIAVINAGGKGTRLRSIAIDIPKPMVNIDNKPILQYQIECLINNGVSHIFIIVGFLGKIIKDYFKDGSSFGINISYVEENEPLGSGGALFFLKDLIKEDFIFLFADLMLDVDFSRMLDFHKSHYSVITLLSHPNSHPFDSDLIIEDQNNKVVAIDSKNNKRNYYYHNLVNSGVYIISPKLFYLEYKELQKIDFEKDIVVKLIGKNVVYSYDSSEYVMDAGTPERLNQVSIDLKNHVVSSRNFNKKQRCIFVDRDGTINKFKGLITDIDDIELENGVIDGIKYLNKKGYLIIIITNQPVVARGDVSINNLKLFHKKIETLLGNEGVFINDIFYCPHHPDKGYDGEVVEFKIDCECRKPKIGLLLKAKEKYNIDFDNSYFVGDTTVDVMTGKNAGIKTILVLTGNKGQDNKYNVKPDYVINNLGEINKII